MSKVDIDLGDLLAKVLPTGVKVTIRHISSAPTPCIALFAPPPGEEAEATFCENHFLTVSVNAEEQDGPEIIVFGVEVLVYSTAHLTTIFVSKADSTGFLHLLKNAPKVSLIRRISNGFLSFLVQTHQRPGVRLVVSLFARAQNQYLFPGSIENPGKHVLDDRGLIKWWCRVFDPILREYEPESGSHEKGLLDRTMESAKSSATAFLIVPGCDRFETRNFFPSTAKFDDQERSRWLTSYPLHQLCDNTKAPPRCLIPRFPDDPKTRFLVDLDDELPKQRELSENIGQWRSVKSLDQFWEMMSFRQECSAGRLVGFLWLIVNPPGLVNSVQMTSSRPVLKDKATDNPTTSGSGKNAEATPHSDTNAFYWPQAGRGHAVLSEEDYKTAINFLLEQDFYNQEVSIASTKAWGEKVASIADQLWVGQEVTGRNTAGESSGQPAATTNLITTGLVRKRKKEEKPADVSNESGTCPPMRDLRLSWKFPDLGPTINNGRFQWYDAVGWVCLIWYTTVVVVCYLGYFQIWRYFSRRPQESHSVTAFDTPHVTAIRPVKGLEPNLYDCLASTFRQDYPRNKLTVYFCVASRSDPGYPTLEKLVSDFPRADARIYVEEEDPLLQPNGEHNYDLGPNPKIRNMSRAYREAKGDIVWIIDCNVWVGKGVCGRMVDRLCGYGMTPGKKYKFVHHLPVAVDVTGTANMTEEQEALTETYVNDNASVESATTVMKRPEDSPLLSGGGRLEELFLSSAHAKMYTAINTVLIAPCIVGKSNMFRRSHLDYLTAPSPTDPRQRNPGIDYFSDNICEDHLIGDLLWKNQVREEKELGERLGKHGMVFGDLAIQPVANMSVKDYMARRVRWLRVRKFTVLLATLVEPGTESLLCSLYGAWGLTTSLAQFLQTRGYWFAAHMTTWQAFFAFFLLSIAVWILTDWTLYIKLHSANAIELDEDTPSFARAPPRGSTRRTFLQWFAAWLGRESLAFPIWAWAFYGGVTVTWRNRRFRVGLDMKVREIDTDKTDATEADLKSRRD
ncbi:histone acetylation protein-domain-containing protein [Aspergillus avenaceus]|uniref:Ceramide glucosyltransferase n=1 Tax=Aspergillus avenaceus TaxID=36643 RepID=A0A5N6U1L4_ASPAV|nr:histone acetylation protein-domain-containing protein [Aspergillus avenaceus]